MAVSTARHVPARQPDAARRDQANDALVRLLLLLRHRRRRRLHLRLRGGEELAHGSGVVLLQRLELPLRVAHLRAAGRNGYTGEGRASAMTPRAQGAGSSVGAGAVGSPRAAAA